MKKIKAYRHGEILFVETSEIPKEAELKDTDTFLIGSHGNPHTFKNGKFYELKKGNFIFGYFKAEDAILYHKQHGENKSGELMAAKLPDGIYELRRGQEFVNSELKPIID